MAFLTYLKGKSVIFKVPRWLALLIPVHYLFEGSRVFDFIFVELCFLYVMHFVYKRELKKIEKEKHATASKKA